MKSLSLIALCSMLLLIPACIRNNNGCCPNGTITTDPPAEAILEQPEIVIEDKEALVEDDIDRVMNNK